MSSEIVTVIMPCYNACMYISEAIEGVLNQSHSNLNLIIVNDNSKDDSTGVVRRYQKQDSRIQLINLTSNKGVSAARNIGLQAAKSRLLAFCDADDIWSPGKLEKQVESMIARPNYLLSFTDSNIINSLSIPTGNRFSDLFPFKPNLGGKYLHQLCLNNFINTSTVIFTRECVSKVGTFDESVDVLEDWIWWIGVALNSPILYISETLSQYRIHDGSTNRDSSKYLRNRITALECILKRYPDIRGKSRAGLHNSLALNLAEAGERKQAQHSFLQAALSDPLNAKYYIRLIQNALFRMIGFFDLS